MGQPPGVAQAVDQTLLNKLKKEWTLTNVPSFEVWSAATCYDPTKTDGGKAFQAMMFWCLTEYSPGGVGKSIGKLWKTGDAVGETLYPLNGKLPKHLQTKDRYTYDSKGGHAKKGQTNYGPKTQLKTISKYYGAPTHSATNTTIGFQDERGPSAFAKSLQISTPLKPSGSLWWYESAGMGRQQTKTRNTGKGYKQCNAGVNASRQFTMDTGGPSDEQGGVTQLDGCISFGNRLAAYYGLYYYKGCEEEGVNWHHTQVVNGTHYVIRMRFPNPAYEIRGTKLWVMETGNDGSLLGDPNQGFEFPQLHGPVTCWDHLARKDEEATVTTFGPWAGIPGSGILTNTTHPGDSKDEEFPTRKREIHWAENPDSQTITAMMDTWTEYLKENAPKFQDRMYNRKEASNKQHELNFVRGEQTGGLAFGWSFPLALCLYPHSGAKFDTTGAQTKEIPVEQKRYQPWPDWRNPEGWREFPYTNFNPKTKPLVDALEKQPEDEIGWALGVPVRTPKAAGKERVTVTATVSAPPEEDVPASDTAPTSAPTQGEADNPENLAANQINDEDREQALQVDGLDTGPDELFSALAIGGTDPDGIGYDAVAGDLNKITTALLKQKLPQRTLTSGAERRVGDTTSNVHFYSTRYSPWPPEDVYEKPVHGFKTDRPMNAAQIANYERDYGSTANLLLRNTKAGHLDFVEGRYGLERMYNGKRILDMPLSSYRDKDMDPELAEMFRRNMRRILSIYWDNSGDLGGKITPDEKRKGMRHGMHMCKEDAPHEIHEVQYQENGACDELLPGVFQTTNLPGKKAAVDKDGVLWRKSDFQLNVNNVVSTMTVLQWLQTPWHYEYLPYQPMTSTFKDGETYCVGCTRCSRPFYEYDCLYASYMKTEKNTSHWVHQYWHVGERVDKRCAPQPFHDKRFWKPAHHIGWRQAKATNGPDAQDQVFEAQGTHNWPTEAFQLGRTPNLKFEWDLRVKKPQLLHLQQALQQTRPYRYWTFRKYINHMWDEEKDYDKTCNLVQGAVRPGAKVAYGMKNYKLMRSIKYGNVCRDCMATLDLAPGLYQRTGRVVSHLDMVKAGKVSPGAMQLDTWWLQLKDADLADGSKFDAWYIYAHTTLGSKRHVYTELGLDDDTKRQEMLKTSGWRRYQLMFNTKSQKVIERKLQLHMDAVAALSNNKNCKMHDEAGQELTKVVKPPDVYVQKIWDQDKTKWREKDSVQMQAATLLLDKLKAFLDGDVPHLTLTSEWRTAAVRDAITDMHYTLSHLAAYKRDVAAPQFDPQMTREEIRDDPTRLKIYQVVKPSIKIREYSEGSLEAKTTFTKPEVKNWEYDWVGDRYVLGSADGSTPAHPEHAKQTRTMTQSRLFITYSLHRAVESELEARAVLEKMADAVRCLFGNDQELCKILLFGMKLEEQTMDAVSRKMYVPIEKARKETTVFYGGDKLNSYLYDTYESHVESVTVDVGVEIGPNLHHPHFHALLTVNHWSYIQVDTFKMLAILEQMFKGTHRFFKDRFTLIDGSGRPFYTDNEKPYINIKVYPTDNWADVIAGYMRKGGERETMLALRARTEA